MDRPAVPRGPRAVLHIVDSLGLGGVQTILRDYLEAQASDTHVHLYALRAVSRQLEIRHPNVVVNPSSRRYSIAPLFALRRLVRRHRIEVLHCHLFRAQVFGYLLKRLFFPRIALIFHEHGRAVGREGESGLEALTFRWFLRFACRSVDQFVCISELTRMRLLQLVPGADAKAAVLANPIPVYPRAGETLDREAARGALGIPNGAFAVGFASRLVQRKGWEDFLRAIALVANRMPVYFLLAGDGEDCNKAKERIAQLGIAARGRVLGHIDWMPSFYPALDCFVMPSHWEPHGLAQLEAQSFGVPVAVSAVPGLSATVHPDTDALIFAPGDVQSLATCIERLAADPALRDRLAAGGRENAKRYSMAAFAESMAQIHDGTRPHAATNI